ncbi:crossover junction endodeoxyribonuclease RuvC [Mesorhizobium sp. B2-5-11]|uniref:crossover junction endodeoxyribonuclease RuvC n=1 Tax=Mesorhizobium sp. B2-5-11 TaxID=2589919 RepID=UPI00112DC94B|nr:crossover junction endodeoxyribonuclease RuvC [Mesorhizobium sp. B2-5-11]TPK14147.1 crossover junction endodeoxyribonuclease RuvC [Mesorhizobium sp. B2-5-11]
MSLILGLDIATVTGFAWYEPGSSLSSIKTGLIKAAGDNAEEKAESLGRQLRDMIKGNRPDFVAIEQPMRNVVSFKKTRQTLAGPVDEQTINPNALQLEGLVCAAVAIIGGGYGIPWETIPSSTWRKHFLGMGRSPGFDRAMWKRAAIERCRVLKIDVKNADAAEAVGIAMAGEACQRFKMARAA